MKNIIAARSTAEVDTKKIQMMVKDKDSNAHHQEKYK